MKVNLEIDITKRLRGADDLVSMIKYFKQRCKDYTIKMNKVSMSSEVFNRIAGYDHPGGSVMCCGVSVVIDDICCDDTTAMVG